jgi:hypothetical protein
MPSNSLNGGGSPEEPAGKPAERLNIREELSEIWGQAFLFMSEPDYDEAIIGVMERAGGESVIAYDTQIILSVLERSMSIEEAQEFFEYNILGAYMGDKTPVYITRA